MNAMSVAFRWWVLGSTASLLVLIIWWSQYSKLEYDATRHRLTSTDIEKLTVIDTMFSKRYTVVDCPDFPQETLQFRMYGYRTLLIPASKIWNSDLTVRFAFTGQCVDVSSGRVLYYGGFPVLWINGLPYDTLRHPMPLYSDQPGNPRQALLDALHTHACRLMILNQDWVYSRLANYVREEGMLR